MIKCITCDQPLPEDEKHPDFFAQYGLRPHTDNIEEFGQGTETLLDYLDAVLHATIDARQIAQEVQDSLIMLARDLTEEAQRRVEKLRDAAEIWQSDYQLREGLAKGDHSS
jgi:hypothetical protein